MFRYWILSSDPEALLQAKCDVVACCLFTWPQQKFQARTIRQLRCLCILMHNEIHVKADYHAITGP
jgi:hypothetical protein